MNILSCEMEGHSVFVLYGFGIWNLVYGKYLVWDIKLVLVQ